MGSHPINLTLRFLLELIALFAMGYLGFKQIDSWFRFVLAIGIPLVFATIWGVFNVPDDPSRSGNAPVIVAGIVRLIIELTFFALATLAIYKVGFTKYSMVFGAIVVLHYVLSYDRIVWLLKN